MLDTAYPIETPEGVSLALAPAGPVARFLAWSIDFCLRAVIYFASATTLGQLGHFGTGLMLVGLFMIEWFYPVLFEVYSAGQTPGKRALGVRVLLDSGIPVGWAPSVIRNLLRAVDFLPIAYGFGVVSMFVTRDFKRLGDLAAGTIVVYTEKPTERPHGPVSGAVPPPTGLRLEEQRAIVNFAERAPGLSEARARELANIAYPLTGEREAAAIDRLYRIANWLQGRQ